MGQKNVIATEARDDGYSMATDQHLKVSEDRVRITTNSMSLRCVLTAGNGIDFGTSWKAGPKDHQGIFFFDNHCSCLPLNLSYLQARLDKRKLVVPEGSVAKSKQATGAELGRISRKLNQPWNSGNARVFMNSHNLYNVIIRISRGKRWYKELLQYIPNKKDVETCDECMSNPLFFSCLLVT